MSAYHFTHSGRLSHCFCDSGIGCGAITEDQGFAQSYISPAENRMLVMMALGIYPFSSQTFAVGDVAGGVKDELAAATRLAQVYLGLKA